MKHKVFVFFLVVTLLLTSCRHRSYDPTEPETEQTFPTAPIIATYGTESTEASSEPATEVTEATVATEPPTEPMTDPPTEPPTEPSTEPPTEPKVQLMTPVEVDSFTANICYAEVKTPEIVAELNLGYVYPTKTSLEAAVNTCYGYETNGHIKLNDFFRQTAQKYITETDFNKNSVIMFKGICYGDFVPTVTKVEIFEFEEALYDGGTEARRTVEISVVDNDDDTYLSPMRWYHVFIILPKSYMGEQSKTQPTVWVRDVVLA